MNDIILSIIIPVYNTEMYLKQCLESVTNIKEDNIEIIVIDDGSKDNSPSIINYFKEQDSRIKVKRQSNKGVSAARNLGIDCSVGKWVTFVDSDDLVDSYTYEYIISLLNKRVGLFFLKTHNFYNNNEIKTNNVIRPTIGEFTKSDLDIIYRGIVEQDYSKYKKYKKQSYDFNGPFAKFFKNKIIKDKKIHFREDIAIGEDRLFNLEYLKYINTAYYIQNYGYFYRQNQMSAMNMYKEGKAKLFYDSIKAIKQEYLGDEFSVAQYGIRHYLYIMKIDFCNLNNPKSYSVRREEAMSMRKTELIEHCFKNGNIFKMRKEAIPIAVCAKYNIFWVANALLYLKQKLNIRIR